MMNSLPSESAGTWTTCPASNGDQKNGSPPPNDDTRLATVFVVEMFTTASLVLRTTSTVTVCRRLIPSGGSAISGNAAPTQIVVVRNILRYLECAILISTSTLTTRVSGRRFSTSRLSPARARGDDDSHLPPSFQLGLIPAGIGAVH